MRKKEATRVHIFLGIVFFIFGLIGYRLFMLAYRHHEQYTRTAQAQTDRLANILDRGTIFFSEKNDTLLAAANKKFSVLRIVSAQIPNDHRGDIAPTLGSMTGIAPALLQQVVDVNSFTPRLFSKHLETNQVDAIQSLHMPGVNIAYVTDRYYPQDGLAADVLGFLGYQGNDRSGQYGIEAYYNEILAGHTAPSGGFPGEIAAKVSSVLGNSQNPQDAQPADVVLTIDKNIQKFVEDTLDEVIARWNAAGGSVIVQDPKTGKILAMADRPTFNPNTYNTAAPELFLNSSVQGIFEPGSSFKPVTMAAGLDLGKVTPTMTYTDTGTVEINGYPIHNFDEKAHGVTTMTQVLEKSLNTGAMFVENLIGNDGFLNYVVNMGFGQKTGIDLPGEVSGDIGNLYSGRKINYLTASFGQGIAVTPLQLINAYSTIANGGKLMRPYVVDRVLSRNGREIVTTPEVIGTPISPKTAAKLTTMLVNVVDRGFDKARISGYDVAGKTGTAQIPDGHGGYLEKEFIHDFLGFAPASDPRFVIMLKLDRPQGITFAADSLSPVFRQIAMFLINYFTIPPTR